MQPSDLIAAPLQRPSLRGLFHLCAAVAASVGGVLLLLLADSPQAYAGSAIFAISLVLLYSVSAAYHRIRWSPRLRAIIRRLDHSMIFALIAGTYTPFCLLKLNTTWGIAMLSVVWVVALAGITSKMLWPGSPRWFSVSLYLAAGWLAVIAAPQLLSWFTAGPLALLALGGLFYTLGGIVYASRRPDPYPQTFGYHEVFHVLVIIGSALHYSLVAVYLLPS